MTGITLNPDDDVPEMDRQGFGSLVRFSLPGHIFSNETQSLRDKMDLWFRENNIIVGMDVDFLYYDGRIEGNRGSYQQLNSIAVWFKDPKLAMLFKLVFA